MSFWKGLATGLQAGAAARDRWDETTRDRATREADTAPVPTTPAPDAGGEVGAGTVSGGLSAGGSASGGQGMPLDLEAARRAIRTIESGSAEGNYAAIGRPTRTGARAYGAYQVMDFNIPQWTEKHFGRRLTPEQFLANPVAQDAVFDGEFGGYMQRHGPNGASRAWFAGERGMNRMGSQDVNRTSVSGYDSRFGRLYQGFIGSASAGGRRGTFTTSDEGEGDTPIRVKPGEMAIAPMFNDVPADAGQRMTRGNAEMEQLVAGAAGGRPGRAVGLAGATPPAAEPPLIDGRTMPDVRTDATGGTSPGARATVQGDGTVLIDGRNLPREGEGQPPAPISSDAYPPAEGTARAVGGVSSAPGGSASVQAAIAPRAVAPAAAPAPAPQQASAPAAAPAPMTAPMPAARPAPPAATPASAAAPARQTSRAPASAPVPQARPTDSRPAEPASALSERDRIMLLRDEGSLGPGEADRLRASLPNQTFPWQAFGLGGSGAPASAPVPQPRPRTAAPARQAPASVEPIRRPAPGLAAAPPPATQPAPAPVAQPAPAPAAAVAAVPEQSAADALPQQATYPLPVPQDDAQRFSNIRAVAQSQLDRGARPEMVARRLTQSGIPYAEWPEPLRAFVEQRQPSRAAPGTTGLASARLGSGGGGRVSGSVDVARAPGLGAGVW